MVSVSNVFTTRWTSHSLSIAYMVHAYAVWSSMLVAAGAAKYSGGCLNFFPGFHSTKCPSEVERFESTLRRYLVRKIGFEAVMRVRCTRGKFCIKIRIYYV